jgi:hypothetical protein
MGKVIYTVRRGWVLGLEQRVLRLRRVISNWFLVGLMLAAQKQTNQLPRTKKPRAGPKGLCWRSRSVASLSGAGQAKSICIESFRRPSHTQNMLSPRERVPTIPAGTELEGGEFPVERPSSKSICEGFWLWL